MIQQTNRTGSSTRSTRCSRSAHNFRQTQFDTDGLSVETPPLEATQVEYGLRVDSSIPPSRLAVPASDAFVDDRPPRRTRSGGGQQCLLFQTNDPSQQTIQGDSA
jgi:hypothetical protein